MSYDELIAEHMCIQARARSLWACTALPESDLDKAVRTLGELARDLDAHLANEDRIVYPQMTATENGYLSMVADQFSGTIESLRADWAAYLREWTPARIAADWTGFCRETHALLERLAARIALENEVLYPAALRHGVIPLRTPSQAIPAPEAPRLRRWATAASQLPRF